MRNCNPNSNTIAMQNRGTKHTQGSYNNRGTQQRTSNKGVDKQQPQQRFFLSTQ